MLNMQQNEKQLNVQGNVECAKKSRHPKKTFIAQHGLNTFDETSVQSHNVGLMAYTCSECVALMFKGGKSDRTPEDSLSAKFTLCCSYGDIKLPPIKEPPEILKKLLTGNTKKD